MKLNKQLIERLANGEIAVDNSNSNLELLKAVLKEAFLRDNSIPQGKSTYYQKHSKDYWVALEFTILPTILLSDFLEEEFVLPEKWCIEVTDENRDILNNYRINIKKYSITPITYKYMYNDGSGDSFTLFYAKEITFKQFLKYILKQETMEKEIIGYKTPYNMYGGQVKKGDIWTLNKYDNGYQSNANVTDLPKEIVEQWEKVYKEEKTIVKMYSSNKGEFEIEVVGKKAYYRPEHKELSLQFIKNILNLFENKTIGLEYSIEVDSLKVGCMEGTRKSDWQKVYDLIK